MTAAQIRAAERAVEQDKRAKDIQAKEKRAREAKRRRDEQEAKQREEQRKLVQLGKLPEESLWGKVRPSQPRLHTYFVVPQHTKAEKRVDKTALENEALSTVARAKSVGHIDNDLPDPGRTLSSAPAILESQKLSPLPVRKDTGEATTCDEGPSNNNSRTIDQEDGRVVPGTQKQLDVQLSFTGSQLFSAFADDGDLEVELNGPSTSPNMSDNPPGRNLTNKERPRTLTPSRKRKADDPPPATPPSAKSARVVFTLMSPYMLNTRAKEKTDNSNPYPIRGGLNHPSAAMLLDEIPTASQVEAMFWSQDFEGDDVHSDKENFNPCHSTLAKHVSSHKRGVQASAVAERHGPPHSAATFSAKHGALKQPSPSRIQGVDEVYNNADCLDDDCEDEFGSDINEEILELASHHLGDAKAAFQKASGTLSLELSALQRSPPRKKTSEQASPLPKVQDPPNGTHDSFYDLDGVNDEDLACLTDMFNSSQNLDHKFSPEKSTGSRARSGRTNPWDMSTQQLREADYTNLDFPDNGDYD